MEQEVGPIARAEPSPDPAPARLVSSRHARHVFQVRRETVVRIHEPVVLIAQPTRSGGTLLLQLLDGHPQLHVRPHELRFIEGAWPSFDLARPPKHHYAVFRDKILDNAFEGGYTKDRPALKLGYTEQLERFPFLLPPTFQRSLFLELAAERPPASGRDIFDCYMTSYFNAWIDNQNLYWPEKRWVVAFRSQLRTPENLAAFFGDYPDGRHLSSVRDPKGWVASSLLLFSDRFGTDPREWVERWQRAVRDQLAAKERYGDRMFLLRFEDVVRETHEVMRCVAEWLQIDADPVTATPTFNRTPIRANSSFRVPGPGVVEDAVEHWRGVLSDRDAQFIDEATSELNAVVESSLDYVLPDRTR